MKHIEDSIQKAIVKWFDYQHPEKLLIHIPNGGKRNVAEAAKFKSMGVRAGVSDLQLIYPVGRFHGAFIEVKSPKGTVSYKQREFMEQVHLQGYAIAVVRSVEEFMKFVEAYLKNQL